MARAFIPTEALENIITQKDIFIFNNKASSMKNREAFIYIKKQNDFLVILKAWSVTPFSSIIPQISYIINKRRYNFVHINPIVNKPNAIYSDK